MQPFHDINEPLRNKLDQSFSKFKEQNESLDETQQFNAVILDVFLWLLGKAEQGKGFNDLYDDYIDQLGRINAGLKEQAKEFRANYPGLFERLSADFMSNSIKSENAEKYLQDHIKLDEYFKGKSLVDAEIEALKLYLPILIAKNADPQKTLEFDQHGEPANTGHDAGESSQLERFDHALFRIVVNQSSTLKYEENSTEHYYHDVQSILINVLIKGSASDFEKIIAKIPTRENFNKETISDVLVEYSQQLYNNIKVILSNQEIGSLVEDGNIPWVYIVEQLMGVYYDLFAAYITKQYPQLVVPSENGILPSFLIIINFFRTITDKLQPFVSNEQNLDLDKVLCEIKERISLIKTSPLTETENKLQEQCYNSLVALRKPGGADVKSFYDIDDKIRVSDMISSPIVMQIPNIEGTLSAEKIFREVMLSNSAFFRDFPSHNFSEIDLIAIHRLFKTFFNHQNVPGNIKDKQSDVEKLLEKDNVENIEAVIFSAKLKRVLKLQSKDATTEDTIFANAVTAVAIAWQYPDILRNIGLSSQEINEFQSLKSNDPTEKLRLAVERMQTPEPDGALLSNRVLAYHKEFQSALSVDPQNRISTLQTLIPAFFSLVRSRSRAFNNGLIYLSELLVSPGLTDFFDKVPQRIHDATNIEIEMARIVQEMLLLMVEDTKKIFPTLPEDVIFPMVAAQIEFLVDLYLKQKTIEGKICLTIVNIMQTAAQKVLSSTEYNTLKENILTLHSGANSEVNLHSFGRAEGGSFSTLLMENLISLDDSKGALLTILGFSQVMPESVVRQDFSQPKLGQYAPILSALEEVAVQLRTNASERSTQELDQIISSLPQEKTGQNEKVITEKDYRESLVAALNNDTDLPLYYDDARIREELRREIEKNITQNFYGEKSDQARLLKILDSGAVPLCVALRLIGSIALGNTESPRLDVDIGRVHSWKAQKFYQHLTCFADVYADNVSEKFTEFLKANGEPEAENVTNIEHFHQRVALTMQEGDGPEGDRNLEEFAHAIEKRLILSIKSGAPIITDRLVGDNASQHILAGITRSEQDFIGFIYNIFTTTKLNQLFAGLVTAEKQIDFVTAVTNTLLSSRECGSDEKQRILAAVRGGYIPVILNSVTDSDNYLDRYLFNFHEKITKNLESCVNVEAELWDVLKRLLSEYNPENKREDKSFITNILDNLEVFHNYLCRSNPAFDRQLSAVIIEKAVYFLKGLHKNVISSLEDLRSELEKIDFTSANKSRIQAFGLTSISGGQHTLTSLVLERMKQPEVARDKDALDAVLALNSKPEPVVVADENGQVIDEKEISKIVEGKVDKRLRIKAIASIWLSLCELSDETNFNIADVLSLLEYSQQGVLTNLDELCEFVKEVIAQAERLSQYKALERILSAVMQVIRSFGFSLDDMNKVVDILISDYQNDNYSTNLRKLLLSSIAVAAAEKNKTNEEIERNVPNNALSFIETRMSELASSREYPELLMLANVLPISLASILPEDETQQPPEKLERRVKFKDEDQPLEDDRETADRYREDNVHSKAFEKVNQPWKNLDRVFVINDQYIQQYLMKKLNTHLDGIVWPIEREAKEAMLKTLQSNLPLLIKLNLVGNIAQGLLHDATFGNTHGIRRRKEDHKLYGYLSGFADITERQKILPQFTTFLKISAPEQVPDSIDNVDHYLQHYAVIQRTLKLIDATKLTGHARAHLLGLKQARSLDEDTNEEVFSEISHIQRFLKTYGKEVKDAIKQQKPSATFNKDDYEAFRDWMELSIATKRQLSEEDLRLMDVIKLNDKNIANCFNFINDNKGSLVGVLYDAFYNILSKKRRENAAEKISKAPTFQGQFTQWVDFALETGDVFEPKITVRSANIDEFRACYAYANQKLTLPKLPVDAAILTDQESVVSEQIEEPQGPSKKEQQANAFALVLQRACVDNYRDGEVLFNSLQSDDASTDITATLPELINDAAATTDAISDQKTLKIAKLCPESQLQKLATALKQFKVNTVTSFFSAQSIPTGMREVIRLIDENKTTVEILLKLKKVAQCRKGNNTFRTRDDVTIEAYQAIDAFFSTSGSGPRDATHSAVEPVVASVPEAKSKTIDGLIETLNDVHERALAKAVDQRMAVKL